MLLLLKQLNGDAVEIDSFKVRLVKLIQPSKLQDRNHIKETL